MIEHTHVVAHGRPASEALAAAIARAKAGCALAPVTVVVPSNLAGLTARRLLGSGEVRLPDTPAGLANVGFLTPFRLAELVAADQLLDRRPLTNPVLAAAVRRALADDPGPFAPVADHHATAAAVAALYAELSDVDDAVLDRLADRAGPTTRHAISLHRAVAERLAGHHDEAALVAAAVAHPALGNALAPFGYLVWHLPEPVTTPVARFLAAAMAAAPTTAVVALTGDDEADARVMATCRRVGVELPTDPAPSAPPTAATIVSVTDADEEVRAVVRHVVGLVADGVPLDRIGVFHPTPEPYVSLLQAHLAAADLPANGPSPRRLADSVAGRTLLDALALPARRWRRDRVMALVAGGPLRHGDGPARPPSWESVSRAAGVVQDRADWHRKLAAHAATLRHRLADVEAELAAAALDDDHTAALERRQRRLADEVADTAELAEFVTATATAVDRVDAADTWHDKAEVATALLHQLLGPGNRHEHWPDDEQAAFDAVEGAVARLAGLDELDPTPSTATFLHALTDELDVARGRLGRFGEGLVFGPLASAVGHDLDAVVLLGCAEGLLPTVRRDDGVLPDAVRAHSDGQLPRRADRLADQHRWFLAALAAAPQPRRLLTFARGDLRGGRTSLPSRWLLDTATALAGETVRATDFDGRDASTVPGLEVLASHATALRAASVHASLVERDTAAVADAVSAGDDAVAHPTTAATGTRRGLLAQAARRSPVPTVWDGNLAGQALGSTATVPISASRLEAWATCGFRYFLAHVLGLDDRDDPERIVELSALDAGSGVHEALERFVGEAIAAGPPAPGQAWSAAERQRLVAIAEEVFDRYEAEGRTGRAVTWQLVRRTLLGRLVRFLDADDAFRAAESATPIAVELPFGLEGERPVELALPDGRTLAFRGMADRVDRSTDGRVLVSDYKTGKGSRYEHLDDDPVLAGTTLQLGLYAEAARQHVGADVAEAHYWMVDDGRRLGYPWTDDRRARFLDVVTAIADGIEGGIFLASPGEWNDWRGTHEACTWCAFDAVCPRDRGEQADAKAGAPELAVRRALVLADDDDGAVR